jgi:predicted ester cyclase
MTDTLLHRWFDEVWNKKNKAAIREMLTDDTVHYGLMGPGGGAAKGFEAFEQFHAMMLDAFPDVHIRVEDAFECDGKLAGRYTATATNSGPLQGQSPTNKKTVFTGGGISTIKDGKFLEIHNWVDFPKMQYDLADGTPDIE